MKKLIANIKRNWKTSLLGGGSLSAAILYYANTPKPDPTVWGGMLVVGILGLVSSDGKGGEQ